MKKTISVILTALMILGMFSAFADSYPLEKTDFKVTFDGAKLTSNYDQKALAEALKGMEPGDDATLEFTLINSGTKEVEWWMENDILKSLEDGTKTATGGAYTYELVYTPASGGAAETLYYSDIVGGEQSTRTGLHAATDALKDYFFLETIPVGGQAKITLKFALDGETQANSYQDTIARLKLNFAVEVPQETTKVKVITMPRTGDESHISTYLILGGASLALMAVILILMKKNRKEADDE